MRRAGIGLSMYELGRAFGEGFQLCAGDGPSTVVVGDLQPMAAAADGEHQCPRRQQPAPVPAPPRTRSKPKKCWHAIPLRHLVRTYLFTTLLGNLRAVDTYLT